MQVVAFCTQCGLRILDGSRFCPGCGQALAERSGSAGPAARAPTSANPTHANSQVGGSETPDRQRAETPGFAPAPEARPEIAPLPVTSGTAGINPAGVLVLLAGAVAMGISPFLPFISLFGDSASLDELHEAGVGSGLMTEILVLAGAGGAFGLLRLLGIMNLTLTRLGGVAVGLLGLVEVAVANSRLEDTFGGIGFAEGFYVLAAGSVAVMVGALIDRNR